jgi:glycosyltransferase involved in cell wall biosynthesis
LKQTLALCVPAYNAAWSLPALFASVQQQRIPFDELLLYNDCSNDSTAELARFYGFTVVEGQTNRGCSVGKNTLASKAKSEWLFFLDSDDILLPSFSETLRAHLSEIEADTDMVLMGYEYFDTKNNKLIYTMIYDEVALKIDPLLYMITTKVMNSSVVRKNRFLYINGFDTDPDMLYIEDRAYSIKTALNSFRYSVITLPCFRIHYYTQSMSGKNPAKWLQAAVCLWEKTASITPDKYQPAICKQLFENGVWAAKFSEWKVLKASLSLAKKIKKDEMPATSKPFQVVFRISPVGAFIVREYILKVIKRIKKINAAFGFHGFGYYTYL